MTKAYDKAIAAVDDAIVKNRSLTPEEAVEALENVRDHVEFWIDAIQGDIDEAAESARKEK